jgi:hypothetical protein
VVGLVLVVALAAAGGCSSGNQGDGPQLPARPAELRLDGLDPCALLTPAQASQLGVSAAGGPEADTDAGSVACQWDNFPRQPDTSYLNRLILDRSADTALGSATGARVVMLDGYAAVETTSPNVDPKEHCLLLVDVAQGESLWVQWMTESHGYPGLSRELACQKAEGAGRLMLANLRTLAR